MEISIMEFINSDALILIPVLNVLGSFIKRSKLIGDDLIPAMLVLLGIALSSLELGFNTSSVIQGILVSGVSVLGHQVYKQSKKEEVVSDTSIN